MSSTDEWLTQIDANYGHFLSSWAKDPRTSQEIGETRRQERKVARREKFKQQYTVTPPE